MIGFTRRVRTISIAVVLLLGLTPAVAEAAPWDPPEVSIENVLNPGKCLEVERADFWGGRLLQWPCHRGPHQRWRLHPVGDYVQLVAEHSKYCAEAGALGEFVRTYPCSSSARQEWRLVSRGRGLKFQNRTTGWWLEVQAAGGNDGQPVVTWHDHEGLHQHWKIYE